MGEGTEGRTEWGGTGEKEGVGKERQGGQREGAGITYPDPSTNLTAGCTGIPGM